MKNQFFGGKIVVDNAIGFWVHRVYQASRNEMYRQFHEQGEDITPEQWAVLIRLWELDGQTQSALSDGTFRDRPTMSRIVDAMQTRGLVTRIMDKTDGRVRKIHLTNKGKALEKKLVPIVQKIVDQMVQRIDESDLETTLSTLRRMFANLAELTHELSFSQNARLRNRSSVSSLTNRKTHDIVALTTKSPTSRKSHDQSLQRCQHSSQSFSVTTQRILDTRRGNRPRSSSPYAGSFSSKVLVCPLARRQSSPFTKPAQVPIFRLRGLRIF